MIEGKKKKKKSLTPSHNIPSSKPQPHLGFKCINKVSNSFPNSQAQHQADHKMPPSPRRDPSNTNQTDP